MAVTRDGPEGRGEFAEAGKAARECAIEVLRNNERMKVSEADIVKSTTTILSTIAGETERVSSLGRVRSAKVLGSHLRVNAFSKYVEGLLHDSPGGLRDWIRAHKSKFYHMVIILVMTKNG